MKLYRLAILICFFWITTTNVVMAEDADDEDVYAEEPEEEKPTNDYCYDKNFECATEDNLDTCDQSIESLCGFIKPTMFGAEPLDMPLDKPMKCNIKIRGICHACRFGKTSNIYKDKKFRTLTFGLRLPYLNILADCDIKLGFIKKKVSVLANATHFNVRLSVDVCDANISHSQMKQCKIDQTGPKKPNLSLGIIEKGKVNKLPALMSEPIKNLVITMIPTLMPKMMQDKISMLGMIGGCPMQGGPS